MPKPSSRSNPLYILVVIAGVLFAVTAFAYFVMALREATVSFPQRLPDASSAGSSPLPHQLIDFLDQHGLTVLVCELAVLAVATFGAMATDSYWTRQDGRDLKEATDESEPLRGS